MIDSSRLERYVTDSRPRFEDLLGQMVEIPSISMDPAKAPDIRRMAEFARQLLTDLGADARIVETGGYPIVSGGWMTGVHHPTVIVYNHMDVQPAQEPEWKQAPFAFMNENGLYKGRGATDDKGPALSALFGARYAIEQGVPINVRFLWELEEEIGSPHFAAGLKNRAAIHGRTQLWCPIRSGSRKESRPCPMVCAVCWARALRFGPERKTLIPA